jgi:general L-amino acid transport system permease protein
MASGRTGAGTRQPLPRQPLPPAVQWIYRNLFPNWWNGLLTLVSVWLLIELAVGLLSWGVLDAVWGAIDEEGLVPYDEQWRLLVSLLVVAALVTVTLVKVAAGSRLAVVWGIGAAFVAFLMWDMVASIERNADPEVCRDPELGACWAVIGDKYRFILFGRYPYDEQWRPLVATMVFLALIAFSCMKLAWKPWLGLVWVAGLVICGSLMYGGFLDMRFVNTDLWGGLPLTLILSVVSCVLAFPIAIALALGRRSEMPFIKAICVGFIELVRGVPLITVLFMASVMLPLFLPSGVNVDKVLRALIGLTLFASAYLAEVIRGGLQAMPRGQFEAADALGLSYPQKMITVILPQALRSVIPPLVNTFIGTFKDTSLVSIISLTDLLLAGKTASADPLWRPYFVEVYVFIAVVYFIFCFSMSKYSQWLERDLARGRSRAAQQQQKVAALAQPGPAGGGA